MLRRRYRRILWFFSGVLLRILFWDILLAHSGLRQAARDADIPLTTNQVGGMFGIFFTEADQVTDYAGATACDVARFRPFFHAMLARGQYLAPSAFEARSASAAACLWRSV